MHKKIAKHRKLVETGYKPKAHKVNVVVSSAPLISSLIATKFSKQNFLLIRPWSLLQEPVPMEAMAVWLSYIVYIFHGTI